MCLFYLIPYAKCALFKFHDLNVPPSVRCLFNSIKIKTAFSKDSSVCRTCRLMCSFLLYYFRLLCQSINRSYYDHVPVKSAETFKSPGNSDKCYNGCLLTRSFNEYICCS